MDTYDGGCFVTFEYARGRRETFLLGDSGLE